MPGLFGSDILPSTIKVGPRDVQLGDVVRRAHADSGLTVEQWNDLDGCDREVLLICAVFDLREEEAARPRPLLA